MDYSSVSVGQFLYPKREEEIQFHGESWFSREQEKKKKYSVFVANWIGAEQVFFF